MDKQKIADGLAVSARALAYQNHLTAADVTSIDALAASLFASYPVAADLPPRQAPVHADMLTARAALELVGHESIVLEWYLDSEKVGTWGIGVTNKSGHNVDRYKDNPQTIDKVLEVYIWLLRNAYIPDVLKAFAGTTLTEAQFAAALSFHYNTGAIRTTSWVSLWRTGKPLEARKFLTSHYLNGGDLQERRDKEAALFFDGKWSQTGLVSVIPVNKPSYTPNWKGTKKVDIRANLDRVLAA